MDKVFIKDLLVRGVIGVYDWEREQPQDILINITIEADLYPAGQLEKISSPQSKVPSNNFAGDFLISKIGAGLPRERYCLKILDG